MITTSSSSKAWVAGSSSSWHQHGATQGAEGKVHQLRCPIIYASEQSWTYMLYMLYKKYVCCFFLIHTVIPSNIPNVSKWHRTPPLDLPVPWPCKFASLLTSIYGAVQTFARWWQANPFRCPRFLCPACWPSACPATQQQNMCGIQRYTSVMVVMRRQDPGLIYILYNCITTFLVKVKTLHAGEIREVCNKKIRNLAAPSPKNLGACFRIWPQQAVHQQPVYSLAGSLPALETGNG